MSDLHEVVFQWPHTEPSTVILTGTFDQWSKSVYLTKGPTGFEGTVKVPWNERTAYKFIVDGQWVLLENQPTEADSQGNINNVYIAPSDPPAPSAQEAPTIVASVPIAGLTTGVINGSLDSTAGKSEWEPAAVTSPVIEPVNHAGTSATSRSVAEAAENAAVTPVVEVAAESVNQVESPAALDSAKSTTVNISNTTEDPSGSAGGGESEATPGTTSSHGGLDLTDTTAMQSDATQIPTEGTNTEDVVQDQSSQAVAEQMPAQVAPDVPISVIPVNASENNTAVAESTPSATQTFPEEATSVPTGVETLVETTTTGSDFVSERPEAADEPSTHSIITSPASESTAPVVGELGTIQGTTPVDTVLDDTVAQEPSDFLSAGTVPTPTEAPETSSFEPKMEESVSLPPGPVESDFSRVLAVAEPAADVESAKWTPKPAAEGVSPEEIAAEAPQGDSDQPAEAGNAHPMSESVKDEISTPPDPASSAAASDAVRTSDPTVNTTNDMPETVVDPPETPQAIDSANSTAEKGASPAAEPALPTSAVTSLASAADGAPAEMSPQPREVTTNVEPEVTTAPVVRVLSATASGEKAEEKVPASDPADERSPGSEKATEATTATEIPQPNGSPKPEEKPMNGDVTPTPDSAPVEVVGAAPSTPAIPASSTPAKKQAFPSSESPSTNSPSSSRVGTTASRKKRTSILGKIKELFSHEKEKQKEKK